MAFNNWLDTFISEKNLDENHAFEITKNGTFNLIPLGVVIEHCKITTATEQSQIKDILVKIDFKNGDTLHFFNHLAGAIATEL